VCVCFPFLNELINPSLQCTGRKIGLVCLLRSLYFTRIRFPRLSLFFASPSHAASVLCCFLSSIILWLGLTFSFVLQCTSNGVSRRCTKYVVFAACLSKRPSIHTHTYSGGKKAMSGVVWAHSWAELVQIMLSVDSSHAIFVFPSRKSSPHS
jgi:hypothetical protein